MGKEQIILIAIISCIVLITIYLITKKIKKNKLKKEIDALNIRYNAIISLPLPLKLTKAQAIAKRNQDTFLEVQEYFQKYEKLQKHIESIQDLLNGVDDAINTRKYSEAKEAVKIIDENIADCEKEINEIDSFLEQFSKKEEAQWDFSRKLKEEYRNLKLNANNNSNVLSIAYEGIENKFKEVENLFSSSGEWMYANEYLKAQDDLEEIQRNLISLKTNIEEIPKYIQDIKGIIPNQLEEVERQYALIRQRGTYIDHLNVDKKLNEIKELLKNDTAVLKLGNIDNINEHIIEEKETLSNLVDAFEEINEAYKKCNEVNDEIIENINELERLLNYVSITYQKDYERFGLEDIKSFLDKQSNDIKTYRNTYITLCEDLLNNNEPTTSLLSFANDLLSKTNDDKKTLLEYKNTIDKSNQDEERAINQLMKLQIVLNEVEVKVREYHLPTISEAYKDDLIKSRKYISLIKEELALIPLNTHDLNTILDEAIDFIYKFYNNVNNVVGMAIMVENAIVFGNKYRSTYPEVDRELSKAEFSFLNGEYTRALTIAISCMEKLFPNNADEKIMENV